MLKYLNFYVLLEVRFKFYCSSILCGLVFVGNRVIFFDNKFFFVFCFYFDDDCIGNVR